MAISSSRILVGTYLLTDSITRGDDGASSRSVSVSNRRANAALDDYRHLGAAEVREKVYFRLADDDLMVFANNA